MLLPIQSPGVRRTPAVMPVRRGVKAALGKTCGSCTELKWPNGTGTGACVMDCCEQVPKGHGWETICHFESCSCPISWPGSWVHWLVF